MTTKEVEVVGKQTSEGTTVWTRAPQPTYIFDKEGNIVRTIPAKPAEPGTTRGVLYIGSGGPMPVAPTSFSQPIAETPAETPTPTPTEPTWQQITGTTPTPSRLTPPTGTTVETFRFPMGEGAWTGRVTAGGQTSANANVFLKQIGFTPTQPQEYIPPAVLEAYYGGQPPSDWRKDIPKIRKSFGDYLHYSIATDILQKTPTPTPIDVSRLVSTGEHLQKQYDVWQERGQFNQPTDIPERVWGVLTERGLATRTETETQVVVMPSASLTYEDVLSAYGEAGMVAPQTIRSFAEFNKSVQDYNAAVQGYGKTIGKVAWAQKTVAEYPNAFRNVGALFEPFVGFGVGFVKGATFGFVGRETPGLTEVLMGGAEIAARGGEEPSFFSTRERIGEYYSRPLFSFGESFGELTAFWGWGKVFGSAGRAVTTRAVPRLQEIYTTGRIVAPRATQMFETFTRGVTAPGRWISAAGQRTYTGAVDLFERVTGKTVWTKARESELWRTATVEAEPLGLRKAWVDIYRPGEVSQVPYLEYINQPKASLTYRLFSAPQFRQSEMVLQSIGKEYGIEMGVIRATPYKQAAQVWEPAIGRYWGESTAYPQLGIGKSFDVSRAVFYTPKELAVVPYPYEFPPNFIRGMRITTPTANLNVTGIRFFGEELGLKYLNVNAALNIPPGWDTFLDKISSGFSYTEFPRGLPSAPSVPSTPTAFRQPFIPSGLGRMAIGSSKIFPYARPAPAPMPFTSTPFRVGAGEVGIEYGGAGASSAGLLRYAGDVGVEFGQTFGLTALPSLGGGQFYFPVGGTGVSLETIFTGAGRTLSAGGALKRREELAFAEPVRPDLSIGIKPQPSLRSVSIFRGGAAVGKGVGVGQVPTIGEGVGEGVVPFESVRVEPVSLIETIPISITTPFEETITKTIPTTVPSIMRPAPLKTQQPLFFIPFWPLGGGARAGGGPKGRGPGWWRWWETRHELGDPLRVFMGVSKAMPKIRTLAQPRIRMRKTRLEVFDELRKKKRRAGVFG